MALAICAKSTRRIFTRGRQAVGKIAQPQNCTTILLRCLTRFSAPDLFLARWRPPARGGRYFFGLRLFPCRGRVIFCVKFAKKAPYGHEKD
jgi:hypothetical protein